MSDPAQPSGPDEVLSQQRKLVSAIHEEVCQLFAVWKVYRQLYADKDIVDLLNQVAPACARIQRDSLLDAVILSLMRLTGRRDDPPATDHRHASGRSHDHALL
jgi:hypothetical protein